MNELALFAGAGGGILGGKLLGWRTICAVEYDTYSANVLVTRQNEGMLEPFPIWDDVRTFDGKPWRGIVDVISGGFPCQDISSAGKRAGIEGKRSGLWKEMARIIGEVRPPFAFVENSPMLIRRGLTTVLSDLAEMGYDAKWGIVSAADVGAPHLRKRIWIVGWDTNCMSTRKERSMAAWIADTGRNNQTNSAADANSSSNFSKINRWQKCESQDRIAVWNEPLSSGDVFNTNSTRLEGQRQEPSRIGTQQRNARKSSWWEFEPNVGRVANGVARRMDRLRCIGNGQVPAVAALAWHLLASTDTE